MYPLRATLNFYISISYFFCDNNDNTCTCNKNKWNFLTVRSELTLLLFASVPYCIILLLHLFLMKLCKHFLQITLQQIGQWTAVRMCIQSETTWSRKSAKCTLAISSIHIKVFKRHTHIHAHIFHSFTHSLTCSCCHTLSCVHMHVCVCASMLQVPVHCYNYYIAVVFVVGIITIAAAIVPTRR